jgi:hypothetical protein
MDDDHDEENDQDQPEKEVGKRLRVQGHLLRDALK